MTVTLVDAKSCRNASPGEVYKKCEMICEGNGYCSESVTIENCGCDKQAKKFGFTYNFKVLTTIMNDIILASNYNIVFDMRFPNNVLKIS